jgi:hypothetical protein
MEQGAGCLVGKGPASRDYTGAVSRPAEGIWVRKGGSTAGYAEGTSQPLGSGQNLSVSETPVACSCDRQTVII